PRGRCAEVERFSHRGGTVRALPLPRPLPETGRGALIPVGRLRSELAASDPGSPSPFRGGGWGERSILFHASLPSSRPSYRLAYSFPRRRRRSSSRSSFGWMRRRTAARAASGVWVPSQIPSNAARSSSLYWRQTPMRGGWKVFLLFARSVNKRIYGFGCLAKK